METQNIHSTNQHQDVIAPAETAATVPPGQPESKKSHAKRLVIIGVAGVVVLGIIAGLLWHNKHKPAPITALTKISVRLQWLDGAEFAGMYVAKDMGYYKAARLDVHLQQYADGVDITKEVATGKSDYGITTPLEVLLGRNSGSNTKAVAAIYQVSPYAIAARKDANIKSPVDFRGKILGSLGNNNEAKVTYAALLAYAGLTASDTTVKGVDFDAVKVLRDHDADTADIYRTDQTFLLDQAHVEYNLIYPENYGLTSYGDLVIASDAKINQNAAQVQAFITATLKGWHYAVDHQSETLSILKRYENDAYKVPGYEKFTLAATAPLIRPTGAEKLGSMDYSIWNRIFLSANAAGLVTTPMEVGDLYTSRFVQ